MKKNTQKPNGSWLELEDAVSQAVALLEMLANKAADSRQDHDDRDASTVACGLLIMGKTTTDRLQAAFQEAFSAHKHRQQ